MNVQSKMYFLILRKLQSEWDTIEYERIFFLNDQLVYCNVNYKSYAGNTPIKGGNGMRENKGIKVTVK